MRLTFDDSYQLDEKPATEEALVAQRNDAIDAWADELAAIAEETLVETSSQAIEFTRQAVTAFASRFLRRIGEIVTGAFVSGAGGVAAVPESSWTVVAEMVSRQTAYGEGFVAAIRSGAISKKEAIARARQYAGAAAEAYERGRAALRGIDLPVYPTQDCEGQTNCRCWWELEDVAGGVNATWMAVDDKGTCETCRGHAADYAPLFVSRSR
jgi:hypothetical protein